ncbi:MAG: hypothetical protein AABW52_03055 [Nanoarchaeota archaeon]
MRRVDEVVSKMKRVEYWSKYKRLPEVDEDEDLYYFDFSELR